MLALKSKDAQNPPRLKGGETFWLRQAVLLNQPSEQLWRLGVRDGRIEVMEPESIPMAEPLSHAQIDCSGFLLTPGFINAHTHAAMTFLKGLGHGDSDVIETVFFPLEKALQPADIPALALPFLIETLRSGVTTILDHYYFSAGVAAACEKSGMRGFIGETIADQGGAFPASATFEKARGLIENWAFGPLVRPVYAPHAADSVRPETLRKVFRQAQADGVLCHMHLAQSQAEHRIIRERHGMSPVRHVHELGGLWEGNLLVHLVHVDKDDLRLIKESGAAVCLCPGSQILYEKLAPIGKLIRSARRLLLGTDCSACNDGADLPAELRLTALLAKKARLKGPRSPHWPDLLTQNPGAFLNPAAAEPLGILRTGAAADLNFFQLDSGWAPWGEYHHRLTYSQPRPRHVMVAGSFVLWDRQPTLVNEESVLQDFHAVHRELRRRIATVNP